MPLTATQRPTDVLRVFDLSPDGLAEILALATKMRMEPQGWAHTLRGHSVACLFEAPSTRTRVAVEAAAHRLGALPIMLAPGELHLEGGESLDDTARVISSYASAIVARVLRHDELGRMAEASDRPVINALSDEQHPSQAIADLLTLRDRLGALDGLRVAFVGPVGSIGRSVAEACALAGVNLTIAAPGGLDAGALADISRVATHDNGSLATTDDPLEAVEGADAVYACGGTGPYRVTAELIGLAGPDAILLHPMPVHRGGDVDAEVMDGPRSAVWQQAANHLAVQQALLYALISSDWKGVG
jgi:ornithine carbamoyltransferase